MNIKLYPVKVETMNIQRLRNLTTGRLHTKMAHVYEDLGMIFGENGVMTHMLPRLVRSIEPWLLDHVTDTRFWDGEFDPSHVGEIELPTPTESERQAMRERYAEQPDPLAGKQVIRHQCLSEP